MTALTYTAAEIEAIAFDNQDDEIVYLGFTRRQLRDAFDTCVSPGANWKAPITALCAAEDRALYVAAIDFYVAGPTTVTPRVFNYRGEQITMLVLTNAGYYANVGA